MRTLLMGLSAVFLAGCMSDETYHANVFETENVREQNVYYQTSTNKSLEDAKSCVLQAVSLYVLNETVPKKANAVAGENEWSVSIYLARPGGAYRFDARNPVEVTRIIFRPGIMQMIYKPRSGNMSLDAFGVEQSVPAALSECA